MGVSDILVLINFQNWGKTIKFKVNLLKNLDNKLIVFYYFLLLCFSILKNVGII